MGQLRAGRSSVTAASIAVAGLLAPLGCGRNQITPATQPTSRPVTVASLVPAATDLIIGMGARDHLIAVSTFDAHRPDVAALPRVGDYQNTDWETLATLDPTCMVIQIDPAHVPPGMVQRAALQHTALLNVTINRLGDIPLTLRQLGVALEIPDRAETAAAGLQRQLDDVRHAVSTQPTVPALLVIGDGADSVAGASTFLDDLLTVAGGTNAATVLDKPWPEIDREGLFSLHPKVVIVLVPSATPQSRTTMLDTWHRLLKEQPGERVFLIDAWYALLPGMHVGDLAAQMAFCLHATPLPAGIVPPTAVE